MPTRVTGTDAVSECDAGVPAIPTPAPMSAYDKTTDATGVLVVQSAYIETKPSVQSAKPMSSVMREPNRAISRLDMGAVTTIRITQGKIAKPASSVL